MEAAKQPDLDLDPPPDGDPPNAQAARLRFAASGIAVAVKAVKAARLATADSAARAELDGALADLARATDRLALLHDREMERSRR